MEVANLDIEEKLEAHDGVLKEHDDRIKCLEIDYGKTEERVSYILKGQDELKTTIKQLENTTLQNNNTMMSMLSQLLINKSDNKTKIIIQTIVTVGALIGGIIAGVKLF